MIPILILNPAILLPSPSPFPTAPPPPSIDKISGFPKTEATFLKMMPLQVFFSEFYKTLKNYATEYLQTTTFAKNKYKR